MVSTTGNARGDLIQLHFPLLEPKLSDHQKRETMVHEYHVTREELEEWLKKGEDICFEKSKDPGAVLNVRQIFSGPHQRLIQYHVAKTMGNTDDLERCQSDIEGMWIEGDARDVLRDWWKHGPKLPHPPEYLSETESLQSVGEDDASSHQRGSVSSPYDCSTSVH